MNKIKEVKERADVVKVANYFNINLNRANKAICPFHKESTASFSINPKKQIWKCFGCGKGGDVISLVQELLNCNAYEASKQVNQICNCGVDFNTPINKYDIDKYKQKQKIKEQFKSWINDTENMLLDYYRILRDNIMFGTIDFDKLSLDTKEFNHVESLLFKLENYPIELWKYEREKVKEVERRYRRLRARTN